MRNRLSIAERRKRQQDRYGWALILSCALALGAMFAFAYQADKARGISVAQSLASAGL